MALGAYYVSHKNKTALVTVYERFNSLLCQMNMFKYDVAEKWQLGFQDPSSPIMEEIINFHHYIFIYLVFILVGVSYFLTQIVRTFTKTKRYISHKFLIHGTTLELVWTITPALILACIAYPSFKLLYLMDQIMEPAITIKAIGHQWYWSYEYSDYANQDGTTINFDSIMLSEDELETGDFRLLEVTNNVVVPVNTHVRVIVTAADVLHSWAVPSLGVKMDAIPGRLNQTSFLATREGLFYGQCSEICGANHAFMPIVVEVVSLKDYCEYISERLAEAREE